jgi:hypothetical protein
MLTFMGAMMCIVMFLGVCGLALIFGTVGLRFIRDYFKRGNYDNSNTDLSN